jgi:hypothetical protein
LRGPKMISATTKIKKSSGPPNVPNIAWLPPGSILSESPFCVDTPSRGTYS